MHEYALCAGLRPRTSPDRRSPGPAKERPMPVRSETISVTNTPSVHHRIPRAMPAHSSTGRPAVGRRGSVMLAHERPGGARRRPDQPLRQAGGIADRSERPHERERDVGEYVVSLGGAQAIAAGDREDQRRVALDEFAPRALVALSAGDQKLLVGGIRHRARSDDKWRPGKKPGRRRRKRDSL